MSGKEKGLIMIGVGYLTLITWEPAHIHGEWIPGYQGLTVLPRRWLLYVCHRLFTQVSVDYMTTKFHRSKTPSV